MPARTRSRRHSGHKLPGMSRHNEGRKPFYKEHRLTLINPILREQNADGLPENNRFLWSAASVPDNPVRTFEIGSNRYYNGGLYSTRTRWTDPEKDAVRKFINAGHGPDEVAPALGRTATSIAWTARDLGGLKLSREWTALITSKSNIASPRRVALCYPFIAKSRPEHADILALNELVPHAYPEHMRADICQEMMLAVIEGRVTIDEIRANRSKSAWFLKKFWMSNYEASGHAVSLNGFEDDDRSYDEVASSISAKEWHAGEAHERTKYVNAMSERFQPPTQLDDVWRGQIGRIQRDLRAQGKFYNFGETADLVEQDGYRLRDDPNWRRSHAFERAEERFGLRLDGAAVKAIITLIESGHGRSVQKVSDREVRLLVAFRGKELPVVYDPTTKTLITVLPRLPQHTESPIKISGWRA